MTEVRSILLLNQVFEDADTFVLWDFDSDKPIRVITEKKAVEQKKLCGIINQGVRLLGPLLEGLFNVIPKRRLWRHTWHLYYNMETIIRYVHEKCG